MSGWMKVNPVRDVFGSEYGHTLCNLMSQLPEGNGYEDPDLVTSAHELTHGINSRVRNLVSGNVNALYVPDNRAFVIKEPPITKSEVADKVPESERGISFALYMSGQPDWDSKPLYILDEWVAYINGCVVALEVGVDKQRYQSSLNSALEFLNYAQALVKCCEEIRFEELEELRFFVNFNHNRIVSSLCNSK